MQKFTFFLWIVLILTILLSIIETSSIIQNKYTWKNQYLGQISHIIFGSDPTNADSKKIGYFSSQDSVAAINLRNQSIVWKKHFINQKIEMISPLFASDKAFIAVNIEKIQIPQENTTICATNLICFQTRDGSIIWEKKSFITSDCSSSPISEILPISVEMPINLNSDNSIRKKKNLINILTQSKIFTLDGENGNTIWSQDLLENSSFSGIFVEQKDLKIVQISGTNAILSKLQFSELKTSDQKPAFVFQIPISEILSVFEASIVSEMKSLVVLDKQNSNFHVIDLENAKISQFQLPKGFLQKNMIKTSMESSTSQFISFDSHVFSFKSGKFVPKNEFFQTNVFGTEKTTIPCTYRHEIHGEIFISDEKDAIFFDYATKKQSSFPKSQLEHAEFCVSQKLTRDSAQVSSELVGRRLIIGGTESDLSLKFYNWKISDNSLSFEWKREESLAEIEKIMFLDNKNMQKSQKVIPKHGFFKRLIFQIEEFFGFAKQVITSPNSIFGQNNGDDDFKFGFSKIIVATTKKNLKVFGLRSEDGSIAWDMDLESEIAKSLNLKQIKGNLLDVFILNDKTKEVLFVSSISSANMIILTTVDGIDGRIIKKPFVIPSFKPENGKIVQILALEREPHSHTLQIRFIFEDGTVLNYPSSQTTTSQPQKQLFFSQINATSGIVNGFTLNTENKASEIWKIDISNSNEQQTIRKICGYAAPDPKEKTASSITYLGGDSKNYLQKYLNPSAFAVAVCKFDELTKSSRGFEVLLIDGVTGNMIFRTNFQRTVSQKSNYGEKPNFMLWSDNSLLVFHRNEKRLEVTVLEMYRNDKDAKITTHKQFNGNFGLPKPFIVSSSYALPRFVKTANFIKSVGGILPKFLLLGTENGQILQLHPKIFDAKRPKPNLEQPAPQQQGGLSPYEPVIDIDALQILNFAQNSSIEGISALISHPTKLESTVHVVALGQDVFHTMISPIGKFDHLSEGFKREYLLIVFVVTIIASLFLQRSSRQKQNVAKWN